MKVSLVLQQEMTECGLAALAMVLRFYGSRVDLNDLRQQFDISTRGTSVAELCSLAERLDFQSTTYFLQVDQVKTLSMPAILYWEQKHYVVLGEVHVKKGFRIFDPSKGKYWITKESFAERFSRFAIVLTPTKNYIPVKKTKPILIRRILRSIPHFFTQGSVILGLTLLLQAIVLLFPWLLQRFIIQNVSQASWSQSLYWVALLLISIKCLEAIFFVCRGLCISNLKKLITSNLGVLVFEHLLHLPLKYFEKYSHNTIYSRFSSIEKTREILSRGLAEGLIDGLFSTMTMTLLFAYSSKIGLFVLMMTLLYLLGNYGIRKKSEFLNEAQISARAKEFASFMECIRSIIPIKIASVEKRLIQKWYKQFNDHLAVSTRLDIYQTLLDSLRILLFGIQSTGAFFIVLALIQSGKLPFSALYGLLFYLTIYSKNISGIVTNWFESKLLLQHLLNIDDILLVAKEETPLNNPFNHICAAIRLENVSFRYHETDAWLFQNINLTIEPGECIALYAPSGFGKTTLLKILMGLVKPTCGHIYYNNILITDKNRYAYRQLLNGVMQNEHLFMGTLYENISFFAVDIDVERAKACAKLAEIHEDIKQMPMAYHSYLGNLNFALSGGQKQRLLLARALYSGPKILFLDEAFSNLEIDLELKLNASLSRLNITRVIISHRPEILNLADRVFDLETRKVCRDMPQSLRVE